MNASKDIDLLTAIRRMDEAELTLKRERDAWALERSKLRLQIVLLEAHKPQRKESSDHPIGCQCWECL